MNLINYGFLPNMLPENADGLPARITAVHKGMFTLICEHGQCYGRLKSSVYYRNHQEAFPTVGDFVLINHIPNSDSQIIATLARKTFFSRRDPDPGQGEQAVAANFDYVFIMQSLNRDFNMKRLERYLSLSWQSGAVPAVILTKSDLVEDTAPYLHAVEKIAPAAGVFALSTKTGFGLEALSSYLKPQKTVVLLGSSGVGKSSLLNILAGEDVMRVTDIREGDSKGRHTTAHRQLIMLKNGAMIIDTPGMRELGMWDASSGLHNVFDDVEQYLGQCKFNNCKHQTEPGCAIKEAIAKGALSQERWESYLSLHSESEYIKNKAAYLRQKENKFKKIAQIQRKAEKMDYRHTPCAESFTCKVCGEPVAPENAGSQHRNHCPRCLSSVHMDNNPGDRASFCKGIMDPIGVWVRKNGEWAIIHRCRLCGTFSSNRIAADDNPALLMSIAMKPLAAPPFPLWHLDKNSIKKE